MRKKKEKSEQIAATETAEQTSIKRTTRTPMKAQTAAGKDEIDALIKQKLKHEVRLRKAQADKIEFALKCDKKEYHLAADVKTEIENLCLAIKSGFEGIGAALAVQLSQTSNPKIIEQLINAKVAAILETLSEYKYSKAKFRRRKTEESPDFDGIEEEGGGDD